MILVVCWMLVIYPQNLLMQFLFTAAEAIIEDG